MSKEVLWCLEKALERTLAGDKEGSFDYLELASMWQRKLQGDG